ncbi:protein phosphatase 1 regulatory subunit 21-like [Pollicipes pollicipes]|uniref:protein phosphatase 1 regulatory subunit 21-like n=1 Tax=Pollicipes pollicipes TaxID=41117 RepID=UPI001884DDD4|nr:protein phosphatase 1 regulatory subunit 21-like [Pollicipes pollicipes]
MSKITDNVKLNEMLSEAESRHQEEVGTLTSRLRQLESRPAAAAAAVCADCERRRAELRTASSQLQQAEAERRRLSDRLAEADRGTAALRRTLAQYTPLLDAEHAHLDRLNVPLGHRSEQRRAAQLAAELAGHLGELAAALSNYHSYCEQRLHALSKHGLSAVRGKLSTLLLAHRYSLSPVPAALQRLTDAMGERTVACPQTLLELAPLAEAVRAYHAFLCKVVSYQQLSLQEETGPGASGQQYVERLSRVAAVFGRLHSALALLARQASRSGQPRVSTSGRVLALLGQICDDLHTSLRELSKSCTVRMSEERDLPSTTAALRTTDECILSSLVAATTAAEKMRSVWAAHLTWMSQLSTVTFRSGSADTGASADVSRFAARCAAYIRLLDGVSGCRKNSADRGPTGVRPTGAVGWRVSS